MRLFGFRQDLLRRRYLLFSTASFVIVLAVWSILSYGKIVDPFFLPPPSVIIGTIVDLFTHQHFLADAWTSIFRVMFAFFISALLAIPIGVLLSVFRVMEALAEPPIDFIRYLPVPALVPLTILWLGIGETSKITLLFIGVFFQLVLLVMDDANNVPKQYLEAAYTLGAGTKDVIMRVLLPAILPNVYDDLRVSLGWAWTYLLVAEIVASDKGIGHVIQEAQRFAKPEVVMSGVIVIGIIGIISDYAFKTAGKFLFRYRRS